MPPPTTTMSKTSPASACSAEDRSSTSSRLSTLLAMPAGTVTQLWRYPVKSMAGEPVRSMRVDWRGAGGGRPHAVLYRHKGTQKHLTARESPGLLAWTAAYPFAPDGGLDPADPPPATVTAPDGSRLSWQDP